MELEHALAWKTNSKGKNYEDRFLIPLGVLPERLEDARDEAEAERLQATIDARKARGLLYAVVDGVGGAPRGMAAAQATVDALRRLYTSAEYAPRPGVPSAREVQQLLFAANQEVFNWGVMEGDSSGRSLVLRSA